MRAISKFVTICLLAFCCINSLQALEENYANSYHYNEQLLDNQRIDKIITNEQGVFLLIDGCWIGTQGMQATQGGIFVLENGEWMSVLEAIEGGIFPLETWECSRCHFMNYEGISACGVCGKPKYE